MVPSFPVAVFSETVTSTVNNTVQMQSGHDEGGADQYDDIIRFYTQDKIFSLAGGGSCEHL